MSVSTAKHCGVLILSAIAMTGLARVDANAQEFGCGSCMVYKTIYEQEPVKAYRLEYETVMQEQDLVVSRPQWVTETRERRFTVAKPVFETATREDRYKVMRPVMETETRYQQQIVRKPVTETAMQNQNYIACEPVTTMRTEYVDRGSYVDQTVFHPGVARNQLRWLPGACAVDPATGTSFYQRGGLQWVQSQTPGTYSVQRQYVPNVVAQQVPQTSYVQKVVTQQVPIQVTRYVDEVVQQPVAVQVCKWVEQEMVRPVTVTTQRIEYEERVEPIQVQTCRWVTETQKVQVPRQVAKWVEYTSTRLVARKVAVNAAADPCGVSYSPTPCCGSAVSTSAATVVPSVPGATGGQPTPADVKPALDPRNLPGAVENQNVKKPAAEPTPANDQPSAKGQTPAKEAAPANDQPAAKEAAPPKEPAPAKEVAPPSVLKPAAKADTRGLVPVHVAKQ